MNECTENFITLSRNGAGNLAGAIKGVLQSHFTSDIGTYRRRHMPGQQGGELPELFEVEIIVRKVEEPAKV